MNLVLYAIFLNLTSNIMSTNWTIFKKLWRFILLDILESHLFLIRYILFHAQTSHSAFYLNFLELLILRLYNHLLT